MSNPAPTKVESGHAATGDMGQVYLATGAAVAMRLWRDEAPGDPKPAAARDYETVGYVVSGRAELHADGHVLALNPGDSWWVPKGASHTYKILEAFTAVEATAPPARAYGRDKA